VLTREGIRADRRGIPRWAGGLEGLVGTWSGAVGAVVDASAFRCLAVPHPQHAGSPYQCMWWLGEAAAGPCAFSIPLLHNSMTAASTFCFCWLLCELRRRCGPTLSWSATSYQVPAEQQQQQQHQR
jgi:hypothetical protein